MEQNKVLCDYRQYVERHKECVEKGFAILEPFLREYLSGEEFALLSQNIRVHDQSKFQDDEFFAYAEYFYGDKEKARSEFEKAKNLHKSRNPHHPEYWKSKSEEMPRVFVVEMVLDWWSFGLMKDDLGEIFEFYKKQKGGLNLTKNEAEIVEKVMSAIEEVQENLRGKSAR